MSEITEEIFPPYLGFAPTEFSVDILRYLQNPQPSSMCSSCSLQKRKELPLPIFSLSIENIFAEIQITVK